MATKNLSGSKYYGDPTRVPAIPDVRSNKPEAVLSAIKEWIEVRQGARGSGLDKAVTFRDLLNSGVATTSALKGLTGGLDDVPTGNDTKDPDVPPTPGDLVASGAVETIMLTWNFARGYSRLAYFEVWRSTQDLLGTAVKIAQVYEPMYVDEVGTSKKFYYWVRAVSDAAMSPFNAVRGTLGETAINVGEVIDAVNKEIQDSGLLDQLTVKVDNNGMVSGYGLASTPAKDPNATTFAILANRFVVAGPASGGVVPAAPFFVQTTPTEVNGVVAPAGVYMQDGFIRNGVITNAKIGNLAVDNAKIANVSAGKLTAGKLGIGEYIESTNFLSGDTGFRIHGNGNAEFQNAVMRGTVYANAGRIGGNVIDSTGIQSPGYTASTGWRINSDGSAVFNTGYFRGNITGASGTFSGDLHGGQFTTGNFSGFFWPANGGGGSYLGPSGLALGNANTNKFFLVYANGDIVAPGWNVVNGVFNITQANVIDTLNVRGTAITGVVTAEGGYATVPGGGSQQVVAAGISLPSGVSGVVVTVSVNLAAQYPASVGVGIYRDGAHIKTFPTSLVAGYATNVSVTAVDLYPPAGVSTYQVVVSSNPSGPGANVPVTYDRPVLTVQGAKR